MTSREQPKNPPKYDIGVAILAGDAFISHSVPFFKELLGKDISPPPQLTGQFLGSLIASATTIALGIELYLKALRMRAGLPIPKTHHLLSLYSELPQEVKSAIEAEYDKNKPPIAIGKTVGFELYLECGSVSAEVFRQMEDQRPKQPPDNSLKAILDRSSDAFKTWRYLHEGGREGDVMVYSFEFGLLNAAAKSIRTILGPLYIRSRDSKSDPS